jgi:uncharacterized repeat protein (TIGR01451 family)
MFDATRAFALTLFVCLATAGTLQSQRLATPAQLQALHPPMLHSAAGPIEPADGGGSGGMKTTTASMPMIGFCSNALGLYNQNLHSMFANDSLNMVGLIHRQNPAVWGGGSVAAGKLRYDFSTDDGASFHPDAGVLNPLFTNSARSPQALSYRPTPGGTPYDSKVVWSSMGIDTSGLTFNGIVSGAANAMDTLGTGTETYSLMGKEYVPQSLCPGLPGEFWQSALRSSVGAFTGTHYLLKGTYNTSTEDVDWVLADSIAPTYSTSFDGSSYFLGPNVAFSPDGNTGWLAFAGDIAGGNDSVYSPVLAKSTDGGDTWGAPMEIDLRAFAWIKDTLQAIWTDPFGLPVGSGLPTTSYEFDLTVDADGNPHFFTVIGNASLRDSLPSYQFFSGLRMFGADITTPDGGITWDVRFIAPVLTLRGEFLSAGGGSPLIQDNHVQLSRSEDGEYLFYLWVDSDTTIIGFGETQNLAPDIYVSGYRVSDGFRTCNKCLTCMSPLMKGSAIYPICAPTVIQTLDTLGTPVWSIPSGFLYFMIPFDYSGPCFYNYMGRYALFDPVTEFAASSTMNLRYNNCYIGPVTPGIYDNLASGMVWYDLNGDGLVDPGEPPAPWRTLTNTAGFGAMSGFMGEFDLIAPDGSWNVALTPVPGFTQTTPLAPGTYPTSFPSAAPYTGLLFGLEPDSLYYDLNITHHVYPFRPGLTNQITLTVRNDGTVPDSGWVTLVHDPTLVFVSTDPPYFSYDGVTHTIVWAPDSIGPLDVWTGINYHATFNCPWTTPVGTLFSITSAVTSSGLDADTTNNHFASIHTIEGSCDPNEKRTSVDTVFSDPDQKFVYTIRFQNVGTAEAYAVRIRDSLDANLDLATFRFLGSSHTCVPSMSGPGHLTFNHPGIVLPDSGADWLGSQGFVMYEIHPKPGLNPGDAIYNSASIYFDYNAPVKTNTTENHYLLVSVDPAAPGQLEVVAYPVPAQSVVNFGLQGWDGQPWKLEILDLQGRVVHQHSVAASAQSATDCSSLEAGMYIWRATQGQLSATGKMVLTK